MTLESCMPVIPSADIEQSLRFWVEGLGLTVDREMRHEGKLIGCMVHSQHQYFGLNQRAGTLVKPENYEGIRLYWAPSDIQQVRDNAPPELSVDHSPWGPSLLHIIVGAGVQMLTVPIASDG